ncbi:hypothetical protein EBT31_14565 [bacterium]|nr:hypothetical protein [bacterium]
MSTYSPDLRIELIANGAQAGTWGTTTNDTWAYVIDPAISGFQTVAVTSANQALTYVSGSTATASANQAIYASLAFTTGLGTAFSVYAPPVSKQYVLWNNSAQSMTIYNSSVIGNTTPAGTGVTIAAGKKVFVFSNGTNFYTIDLASVLSVVNGGTGVATLTGVAYGNGTSAFTAATGTQIATAIGSSAVTNSSNLTTTNFTITESGGKLVFKYGATTVASMDSSGNITSAANITAYGTP